jgi:hypothetical protein
MSNFEEKMGKVGLTSLVQESGRSLPFIDELQALDIFSKNNDESGQFFKEQKAKRLDKLQKHWQYLQDNPAVRLRYFNGRPVDLQMINVWDSMSDALAQKNELEMVLAQGARINTESTKADLGDAWDMLLGTRKANN